MSVLWSSLSSDTLRKIFQLLPIRSLITVRRICKHWNEAARGLGKLSTADMGGKAKANANDVISHLPAAFNRLNALSLSLATTLNDDGMVAIGQMTCLKELDLSHRSLLTDTGIFQLRHIPWLTALTLKGCHRVTDKGLVTIGTLTTLIKLDLSLVPRVTSEGISFLCDLKKLEDLRITGCRMVKTEAISFLSLPVLRILDIRSTQITLSREEVLDAFPTLKSFAVASDTNLPVGSLADK